MNVYRSQLWRLNNKSVECSYVTLRKSIRIIRRLDNRTHNNLINLINRCLSVSLMFEYKQCITFIWNLFNSPYELHKSVIKYFFYNGASTHA